MIDPDDELLDESIIKRGCKGFMAFKDTFQEVCEHRYDWECGDCPVRISQKEEKEVMKI